jgi:hypothetical protein
VGSTGVGALRFNTGKLGVPITRVVSHYRVPDRSFRPVRHSPLARRQASAIRPHSPVNGNTTVDDRSLKAGVVIGTGWDVYNMFQQTDINGDGVSDIIARGTDGTGKLNGTTDSQQEPPGERRDMTDQGR